jgi:hypothetical protein
MLNRRSKSILILVAILTLCTCIDPYTPELTGYKPLLVIDGLITNANSSYSVRLSQTFQEDNAKPLYVSNATISISDDLGNVNNLTYRGNGTYATDSTQFTGLIGRTYTLHVLTPDGGEYESDPCFMNAVPDIDSIYFEKDQELIDNGTGIQQGARIYLDSRGAKGEQYYRWAYNETWKFKVPNPKKYSYVYGDTENSPEIVPADVVNEYCWKNNKSSEILINDVSDSQTGIIERKPIAFIAPDKSDRFNLQYSILINQYSLSKKEYEFWNNMKQVNEQTGDIFSRQPYAIRSNIHNIKNPDERIMGYFQVSAVKTKRRTFAFREILALGLPFYIYPCERIIKEPRDFDTEWGPKHSWNYVYNLYCVTSRYAFVEPIFKDESVGGKQVLYKLVFTTPPCADCALNGVSAKPDFWVDLK